MLGKVDDKIPHYTDNYIIYEISKIKILELTQDSQIKKELSSIFKIYDKKSITNKKQAQLENILVTIETLLNYIDSKERYISNKIRKMVASILIDIFTENIPEKDFYREKLYKNDFTRIHIMEDLKDKNINQNNLLESFPYFIPVLDKLVEKMLEKEKIYLFNSNNKKLYNQMIAEKAQGKIFHKEELTYDVLFELAIIENIPDSVVANIYNCTKNQIRYHRRKLGIILNSETRIKSLSEGPLYLMEENNQRPKGLSNYELEKLLNQLSDLYLTEFIENKDINNSIPIKIDTKMYNVTFVDEKYSVNSKSNNKTSKGSTHNHRKENETKMSHGAIGEKIVLEMEKERLTKLGLENLTSQVQLVAQIDEETTFDGLGYDIISFNEKKERICIEVKTSFGKKDKPFFISKKELEIMKGIKEEHQCKYCLIYYVLIDGNDVKIKSIYPEDIANLKLTPVLYKVG